jgi:hypothetical protein
MATLGRSLLYGFLAGSMGLFWRVSQIEKPERWYIPIYVIIHSY